MFAFTPLPRNLEAGLRDAVASKPEVRCSALRDLVRHADGAARDRVIACLVGALTEDGDAGVRATAALALADIGATEALDALLAATDDVQLRVRQLALVALGEIATAPNPTVRAAFEAALVEEAPALRYQALVGLAQLGEGDLEARLLAGTQDPDATVRHVALRLLEEQATRGDSDEASLEGHEPSAPLRLPAPVGARVRALLGDAAPEVRLVAAVLLARAGDPAGDERLIEVVNGRPGRFDPEDEQLAVELVGLRRLAAARRGLQRRAFGWLGVTFDPTSFQARVALARWGDERAVRAILRGLEGRHRHVRTIAAVAAGRARLVAARPLLEALASDPRRAEPAAVAEALARLTEPETGSGAPWGD